MARSPCLVLAVIAFVATVWLPGSYGKRTRVSQPPIVGETGPKMKHKRPAECQFGGKTYELLDTWHPDLGPPFGTQYCVKCECVEVRKKRRVVGKVHCRNFRSECAQPMCEEPVLLPGQCCKTCPENPDVVLRDLPPPDGMEYDNKQSNEYAALLTGLSMNPPMSTSVIGSGRFTFAKRNIYYSIYLGRDERISYVRFVDGFGNILEEQEVDKDGQRAKSGKICGVWRRIPKIYRKNLKEEKLFVELVSDANSEGVVRGRLMRYRSLSTESFSALLRPPPGYPSVDGGGGFAIISTMSTTASVIHLQIIFNGIVSEKDPEVTTLELRISTSDRTPVSRFEGFVKLHSPNQTYNSLEWKMELSPLKLRTLLMGKPILSIAPRHKPDYRLEGPFISKSTCSVFQVALSSANSLMENQPVPQASGLALVTINDDTSLNYLVYISGLELSRVLALTLETPQKKRRQIIENLPNLNNSWINGTYTKMNPRDIEMLLAEELVMNVDTEQYEGQLRGHVVKRLYSEARASNSPVLLSTTNQYDSSVVGQAWIFVDSSCKLAYDVVIAGLAIPRAKDRHNSQSYNYMLKIVNSGSDSASAEKLLLTEFNGNEIEDVYDDPSKRILEYLDSGETYLHVTRNATLGGNENEKLLLKGRINNVRVPKSCLPQIGSGSSDDGPNNIPNMETYNCYYEGRLFEDGSQWTAKHDSCMMCSCQRSRVVCEPVICPRPHCNDAVLLSGECCLSCLDILIDHKDNISKGCYFEGDKKMHQAGTIWHPYVPPFGFSTCAICKCDPRTWEVTCDRITCPPLPCEEKDAVRVEPQDCCKVCAVSPSVSSSIPILKSGETLKDEESARNNTDILAEGGCEVQGKIYANGEDWHPTIQSFGEEKCVLCYCKDGIAKCRRLKCPELTCDNRIEENNQCCQRCADGSTNTAVRYRHKGSGNSKKRRKTKQQPGQ